MKNVPVLIGALWLMLYSSGCVQDKCTTTRTYIQFTPIYKTMDEVREMVSMEGPRTLQRPGKIYVRDHFLFVNEYGEGVHIIDYSNPQNPKAISFLHVPGNVDIAVKGNVLYADQFKDLVAFDISILDNITEVSRVEDAFPRNISVHPSASAWSVDDSKGVAIDWLEEEIEVDCDMYGNFMVDDNMVMEGSPRITSNDAANQAGGNQSNGQGGSMARFSVMGDYLYTIDQRTMHLFNLQNAADPVYEKDLQVGWGIETIFPFYRDNHSYLFIGSNDGMYIYNNDDPMSPFQEGYLGHVSSCDPVVPHGQHAYITLRSGNSCQGFTDQLEIADISDMSNPKRIEVHKMSNPWGLGVDNDLLFICDGRDGLKVFDLEDPAPDKLKTVAHFEGFSAYDVIPFQGTLILSSSEGIHFFNYQNPKKVEQQGKLSIQVEQ